ncbi:MAG: hypothetical protein ACYDG5_08300 [Dehalococcoidales bacterium]
MDSSIVAAIVGIGGVVIGSALTFLMQWLLAKRQRSWQISDNDNEHQRAIYDQMRLRRYDRLKDQVNIISEQIGQKVIVILDLQNYLFDENRIDNDQFRDIQRKMESREGEVLSAIMATGSEELHKLYLTLDEHFSTATKNADMVESEKTLKAARVVHRKMEELLDETLVR